MKKHMKLVSLIFASSMFISGFGVVLAKSVGPIAATEIKATANGSDEQFFSWLQTTTVSSYSLADDTRGTVLNSEIKYYKISDEFKLKNLKDLLINPYGKIDNSILKNFIDINQFPADTTFKTDPEKITINNERATFSFRLETNKYFENWNIVEASKTYDITFQFPIVPNLTIIIPSTIGVVAVLGLMIYGIVYWTKRRTGEIV